jgi:hypothetical protein
VTCLVLAVSVGRAHAQNAEAEVLFTDANRLIAEGKLAEACDAFEASNRVEPGAGTLLALGQCREQNHQLASAWSAYKDALSRAKDSRKRDFATARIKALEPRLSYLTVSVPDDSRIDGLTLTRNGKSFDPALWSRALPVDGGVYLIAGNAPGRQPWQATAQVPADGAKISIEVPKLEELSKPLPPRPPPPLLAIKEAPAAGFPPTQNSGVVVEGRDHSRHVATLVTGGLAVIFAGAAITFELSGRSTLAQSRITADPVRQDALYDSANHKHYAAESLAIGSLGCAIAAVTIVLRGGSTSGVSIRAAPSMSGFAVSLKEGF